MESNESYQVRFLPAALSDLGEIMTSFAMLGSKQGALRIRTKVLKAAAQIARFPYSGVIVPDEKLAKSEFRLIAVENYLMFYKAFDDTKLAVIYRVINGKRNYPTLLLRLQAEIKEDVSE